MPRNALFMLKNLKNHRALGAPPQTLPPAARLGAWSSDPDRPPTAGSSTLRSPHISLGDGGLPHISLGDGGLGRQLPPSPAWNKFEQIWNYLGTGFWWRPFSIIFRDHPNPMRKKGKILVHLEIFWFEHLGKFIVPPKLFCSPTAPPSHDEFLATRLSTGKSLTSFFKK